jgi:ubiquinone/menaquinone biosynthesis C-methylase UbiE
MTEHSNSPDSEKTYFIDSQSAAEMARLMDFDRYLTRAMGGPIEERTDFTNIKRILDIACGPGGWVLDMAVAHPEIEVFGIDINRSAISYAQSQAKAQGLNNVMFRAMNAVEPLDFPDEYFELVNARSIGAFMPPTRWPEFVQDCKRILRNGGTLRLTEGEWSITNTPAMAKLNGLLMKAVQMAGLSFSPDGRHSGIVPVIAHFLKRAGFQDVDQRAHVVDYSAGTEANPIVYNDAKVFYQLIQPFIVNMRLIAQEEYEQLYQQALTEMLMDDFCGMHFLLTAWGTKP